MNVVYIGEKIFCKNSSFKCQARPPERGGQWAETYSGGRGGAGSGLEEVGWPVRTASPAGRPWEVVPDASSCCLQPEKAEARGGGGQQR